MFKCCTKESSVINLDLFWKQVFSYISFLKGDGDGLSSAYLFLMSMPEVVYGSSPGANVIKL